MLIDVEKHRLQVTDLAQAQGMVQKLLNLLQLRSSCECELVASRRYTVIQPGTADNLGLLKLEEQHQLDVVMYRHGQVASYRARLENAFDPDAFVEDALAFCSQSPRHPCAGLPYVKDLAWECRDLDLFHDWRKACASTEYLVEKATKRIHNIGYSFPIKVHFRATAQTQVVGNTLGFIGGYRDTLYELNCLAGALHRGVRPGQGVSRIARDLAGLGATDDFVATVSSQSNVPMGDRRLPLERCAYVFSPGTSVLLLNTFLKAVTGQAVANGDSVLCGYLDKPLFGADIGIVEMPMLEKGVGSMPFDRQGCVPSGDPFVKDGRLVRYALDAGSARRLGLQNTGNSTHAWESARNLAFTPGQQPLNELLALMGKGVLVSDVRLLKLDVASGQIRLQLIGTWVDAGVPQYRLKPFAVQTTLLELFQRIRVVGAADEFPGRSVGSSLFVEQLDANG